MIEINTKIRKVGNSYAVLIPKALINCKVLTPGQELTLKVDPAEHKETILAP